MNNKEEYRKYINYLINVLRRGELGKPEWMGKNLFFRGGEFLFHSKAF